LIGNGRNTDHTSIAGQRFEDVVRFQPLVLLRAQFDEPLLQGDLQILFSRYHPFSLHVVFVESVN
jgi:hypothetical protein